MQFCPEPVDPLTEDEVAAMFRAVDEPGRVKRRGQQAYEYNRRTKKRDRALMMALLDTGVRASEFCEALYKDLDIESGKSKLPGKEIIPASCISAGKASPTRTPACSWIKMGDPR